MIGLIKILPHRRLWRDTLRSFTRPMSRGHKSSGCIRIHIFLAKFIYIPPRRMSFSKRWYRKYKLLNTFLMSHSNSFEFCTTLSLTPCSFTLLSTHSTKGILSLMTFLAELLKLQCALIIVLCGAGASGRSWLKSIIMLRAGRDSFTPSNSILSNYFLRPFYSSSACTLLSTGCPSLLSACTLLDRF